MTCVVYKHPFIVGDQKYTRDYGNTRLGRYTKIYVLDKPAYKLYTAYAGDSGTEHLFNSYMLAAFDNDHEAMSKAHKLCKEYSDKAISCVGIVLHVVDKKVTTYTVGMNLLLTPIEWPYLTIGSGEDLAAGAFEMGADAWQAVDVATRMDGACGYPLDGYNVVTGEYTIHYSPATLGQVKSVSVVSNVLPASFSIVPAVC